MATPALPGPAFTARALDLKVIPAGGVWRRIYETRFPNPLGWGPGLNRFSDPTGHAYGVVYLGESAKVAFVETLLRDAGDGRGDDLVLALAEIEARSLASLEATADLQLVDLTGDGRLRMVCRPMWSAPATRPSRDSGQRPSMPIPDSRTASITDRA